MDISFVTRKFQRSIAGLGLATILAASVFTGSALGMTFDDVSSDNYAFDAVDWASDAGIMTGYEGTNTFGRADTLTREQAAKIIIEAFDLPMDSSDAVTCTGNDASDWAQSYVAAADTLGIMSGEGDGSCNYQGDVNRAQFAKMVFVGGGYAPTTVLGSDVPFLDVHTTDWFDYYVGQAWSYSIVNGMTSTTYAPEALIIRADAAVMIDRAVNSAELRYPDVTVGDDDDTTTTGGALEVILANDSAEDYTYFSAGTNAEVADFEVTASDTDVVVTSFDVQLASGDKDSVLALALYNADGTRISKVDTSIDSDDMAHMTMLDGGYTVAAGTSENFRLMNTFAAMTDTPAANTSTLYSYSFDSSMVESDASSVEVENNLKTGIFGLLDNNTGALTVSLDSVPSDVQVGETDAVIASFEMDETSNDKDVSVMGITLENNGSANLSDAVDELALYFDGDWVADGTQFGDYISFQMDSDVAPLIEAGNTESFEVRARITGESSETLNFSVEEALDVRAVDEDDNDVAVTNSFAYDAGDDFNIDAGAVSVVAYDADSDKFRADRQDVELGRFEVTAGTSGLTLNTINLDVDVTDGANPATNVSDLFENFSVKVNGARNEMDLDSAAGASETYTVDTDKSLTEGTVYEFIVYADSFTVDEVEANIGGAVADYTDFTVQIGLSNLGTGATTDGLVIEEDASSDQVTDFTPSAVTFNDLQGETAGVDISAIALSSAKDAVVGSSDVLALEFDVEESADVSDLTIKDLNAYITVDEDGDGTYAESNEDADNSNISSVDLYQVNSDDTETLLDSVSGSNLGTTESGEGTPVNFEFGDLTVAQSSTETFRVYVSFVDDTGLGGHDFRATVGSYSIRDDENNPVYDAGDSDTDGDFTGADTAPWSGRTINLVATGTLYVNVDNTDDTYGTEAARWLLAGESGVGLMTIEVRAENEDVTIEDYTLTATSAEDSLYNYFSTIHVYDENGVEVGSRTLNSSDTSTVVFDSSSTELTAYAGDTVSYYFVGDLLPYGKEYAGAVDGAAAAPSATLAFSTDTVTGVDSNDTYTAGDDDGVEEAGEVVMEGNDGVDAGVEYTADSEAWDVVASRISNVAFVSSAPSGEEVDTTLTGGENLVAILAVTTDDTNNTEADGTDIATILAELNLNMYFSVDALSAVRVDLLGTSSSADATDTTPNSSGVQVEFLTDGQFDDADLEIDPGETIYLGVYGTIGLDPAVDGEYVQVKVDDINAAWLDWNDSADGTTRGSVYMGNTTKITATKVNEA